VYLYVCYFSKHWKLSTGTALRTHCDSILQYFSLFIFEICTIDVTIFRVDLLV